MSRKAARMLVERACDEKLSKRRVTLVDRAGSTLGSWTAVVPAHITPDGRAVFTVRADDDGKIYVVKHDGHGESRPETQARPSAGRRWRDRARLAQCRRIRRTDRESGDRRLPRLLSRRPRLGKGGENARPERGQRHPRRLGERLRRS